ncbi:MAG: hypothetical protein IT381_09315 [Deltaproteobacteria bacterium]|nr:hypothetical protein [Deltaproteobacteria bacterium]
MHVLESLRNALVGASPWTVLGISLVAMVLSCAILVVAIIAFPEDYFASDAPPTPRHPVLAVLLRIGKNLLGVLFIAVGALLSIPGVPGQGLMTIAIGILLLDLPKKRSIERRLLENRHLQSFINGVRSRFHRPPLRLSAK